MKKSFSSLALILALSISVYAQDAISDVGKEANFSKYHSFKLVRANPDDEKLQALGMQTSGIDYYEKRIIEIFESKGYKNLTGKKKKADMNLGYYVSISVPVDGNKDEVTFIGSNHLHRYLVESSNQDYGFEGLFVAGFRDRDDDLVWVSTIKNKYSPKSGSLTDEERFALLDDIVAELFSELPEREQ